MVPTVTYEQLINRLSASHPTLVELAVKQIQLELMAEALAGYGHEWKEEQDG